MLKSIGARIDAFHLALNVFTAGSLAFSVVSSSSRLLGLGEGLERALVRREDGAASWPEMKAWPDFRRRALGSGTAEALGRWNMVNSWWRSSISVSAVALEMLGLLTNLEAVLPFPGRESGRAQKPHPSKPTPRERGTRGPIQSHVCVESSSL